MSPFILDISPHAVERLKQRKISRSLVRKTIVLGQLVSVQSNGRNIRQLKVRGRTLEVIYLNCSGGFILVTCYWLGEGL